MKIGIMKAAYIKLGYLASEAVENSNSLTHS